MWWLLTIGIQEALFARIRFAGDLRQHVVETILLLLACGLFYLFACYRTTGLVRSQPRRVVGMVAAALLFRCTLWPVEPAFTDDLYRYRWEGKLQAAGGNPYAVRAIDPGWAHIADPADLRMPGREFWAVYGPLTQWVERLTWEFARRVTSDADRQAFWFKAPAASFDLLTIGAVLLLLKARGLALERVVVYAWSPLPVFEFWGMGHNDSIALAFLTAAVAAAESLRWGLAWPALAAAAAAKIWPLGLAPILWRGWRQAWILPVLLVLSVLPFWPGWGQLLVNARFASGFIGGWRNNDSLFGGLLWLAGGDLFLAKKLALLGAGSVLATVVALRWKPAEAALAVIAGLLAFSANCHPWYLTWMLPLLAVVEVPALLLWTTCAPLAYVTVLWWVHAGEWRGNPDLRWLVYIPVFALLAWRLVRRQT